MFVTFAETAYGESASETLCFLDREHTPQCFNQSVRLPVSFAAGFWVWLTRYLWWWLLLRA